MLRTLISLEKYKTNIDDMWLKEEILNQKVESIQHCRNILQWGKNDFKSMIHTNGVY